MPGSELVVLDVSALASVLFNEPDGESILARLEGRQLAAPSLLLYEIASVAQKKIQRESWESQVARRALARLSRLVLRTVPVAPEDSFDMATETSTSPYDGAYIWLARRLGAPLVTKDRGMAQAAAQAGVPIG